MGWVRSVQPCYNYAISNQAWIRSWKHPTKVVVVVKHSKLKLVCRSDDSSQQKQSQLQPTITAFPPPPPIVLAMGQPVKLGFGVCVAATFLVLGVRAAMSIGGNNNNKRSSRDNHRAGSVAHLVRRGQLKSDTRGITRPLKYDDPFNNPMVKVGKSNSTVEMCGKVYRLAPVTLTEEQQAIHQKRRSRAYQWKRPTVFLKEGDSIPPDVDPDTVRWIPSNHPFATTAADIDEDLAHNNVRLNHGVPFRIQAQHQALRTKLEALHHDQKPFDKSTIDSSNAVHFDNPSEQTFSDQHIGNSKAPLPERLPNSSSEELQKP